MTDFVSVVCYRLTAALLHYILGICVKGFLVQRCLQKLPHSHLPLELILLSTFNDFCFRLSPTTNSSAARQVVVH